MIVTTAQLNTPKSASYLKKLCHHFQIKVPVVFNEKKGSVQFPAGMCEMMVEPESLLFRVETENEAGLAQIKYILDSHIEQFTKRDPLKIEWANPA